MTWVADVVDAANKLLGDRHAAIGPSHFLREDLTEDLVEMIWKHSVRPYLEDQLIDEPSQLARYDLERLRSSNGGDQPEPAPTEPTGEEPGA